MGEGEGEEGGEENVLARIDGLPLPFLFHLAWPSKFVAKYKRPDWLASRPPVGRAFM